MRVLVACEFSGIVRDAFRQRGHDAWSCDILESEGSGLFHFKQRVELILGADWELMVAFPPCTYLTNSGARWWKGKEKEQTAALNFVRTLMGAPIPRIAIENPPGKIGTAIRPADQYIQPWQFSHGETKKTGLWLKNLPLLKPTFIVEGRRPRVHHESPGPDRWKRRSRTLSGIAAAMAEQWGNSTWRFK
jgi:hypothetical protein